ncbi:MAG: c-type heme family protein [Pirellulaceae bacterium]
MIRSALISLSALLVVMLAACNSSTPTPVQDNTKKYEPVIELTETQQEQKQRALSARDKLFASLFEELTGSMAANGPAASIEVCKSRAPELAQAVSEETGVRIGRTSFRLRNPDNIPPGWARRLVEDRVEQEQYVTLPGHGLGVLLPIPLMDNCLQCHGNDVQVTTDVRDAILSLYPEDAATGFVEGELRGYFWIEVPAQ